jgi:uncharacterized cofD-like protein
MIVIGPGDLYGSILPNLIIEGMSQALARCRAKVVYIANLMTRYSQTHNMRASDHVYEVEKRIGRKVDKIILNNKQIPKSILKSYEVAHEFPVEDDIKDSRALRSPLIVKSRVKRQKGDVVDRSYLRHDPGELAKVLINFL